MYVIMTDKMDTNTEQVEFYTVNSPDADSVFGDSSTSASSDDIFQPLPKGFTHTRLRSVASDSSGASPKVYSGGHHVDSKNSRIILSSSASMREFRFSSSSSGTSLRDDSFGSLFSRSPRSRLHLYQRRNLHHKGIKLNHHRYRYHV